MPKKPKKLLRGGPETATLPAVSLRGGLRAGLRTALDKLPYLGPMTKWLDNLAAVQHEERLALWLEYVRGDHSGEEFKAKIEDGLRGPHAEYVRDAVLESTRAATEALDDAAIPAIGRLTSQYLHTKTPDLWTYRDLLALLRSLDREMLDALRAALSRLDSLMRAEVVPDAVPTEFDVDPDHFDTIIWRVSIAPSRDRLPSERNAISELGRGPVAERLVTALCGSSAGLFAGRSRVNPPHLSREIVKILLSVL